MITTPYPHTFPRLLSARGAKQFPDSVLSPQLCAVPCCSLACSPFRCPLPMPKKKTRNREELHAAHLLACYVIVFPNAPTTHSPPTHPPSQKPSRNKEELHAAHLLACYVIVFLIAPTTHSPTQPPNHSPTHTHISNHHPAPPNPIDPHFPLYTKHTEEPHAAHQLACYVVDVPTVSLPLSKC